MDSWFPFTATVGDASGPPVQLMMKGNTVGSASELEYKLMITDLSFIWVGVATRQEVEQQVSARAETSRVTFTIERLKQMLEEGFAAPAESGRRWELDQDVRGEEGLLPTFQLKLIDVTRTTSVDWRFQCNRDDTGAIKMHLTHPLILVIGEMQTRVRLLKALINQKDDEIQKHKKLGSMLNPEEVETETFTTYDNYAMSLPSSPFKKKSAGGGGGAASGATSGAGGKTAPSFVFNFGGQPMNAFVVGSDLAKLYPAALEQASKDAAGAAKKAASKGGGGGSRLNDDADDEDDEATAPIPETQDGSAGATVDFSNNSCATGTAGSNTNDSAGVLPTEACRNGGGAAAAAAPAVAEKESETERMKRTMEMIANASAANSAKPKKKKRKKGGGL